MLAYTCGLEGNIVITIGLITGLFWVWHRDLKRHF